MPSLLLLVRGINYDSKWHENFDDYGFKTTNHSGFFFNPDTLVLDTIKELVCLLQSDFYVMNLWKNITRN